MTPERQEEMIQRRVIINVVIALDKLQFNRGRYIAKDYQAYLDRVRARYVPTFKIDGVDRPATERFAALGQAMADHLMYNMCRPGVLRMMLTPNDPTVVAYRWQQEQIKGRIEAIMGTILPYNRRGYYADKGYVKTVPLTHVSIASAVRPGSRITVSSSLAQRLIANRGKGIYPFSIPFDSLFTNPEAHVGHLSIVGYLRGAPVVVNEFYAPDRFVVQDTAGPFEFIIKE